VLGDWNAAAAVVRNWDPVAFPTEIRPSHSYRASSRVTKPLSQNHLKILKSWLVRVVSKSSHKIFRITSSPWFASPS